MPEIMNGPAGSRMAETAAELLIQGLGEVSVLYLCHIYQRGDRCGHPIPYPIQWSSDYGKLAVVTVRGKWRG